MVESALREVQLWDAVKDNLKKRPRTLTLEQQQKLCIARLLPLKPRVILMDEPCSALDAEGIERVEELIGELRERYTVVIVTHNMAQARRATDECIYMLLGEIIEHARDVRSVSEPTAERNGNVYRRSLRLIPDAVDPGDVASDRTPSRGQRSGSPDNWVGTGRST